MGAGALVYLAVGALWYTLLARKLWLHAMGVTRARDIHPEALKVSIGLLLLAGFGVALGLAVLLDWSAATSLRDGAYVGLVAAGAFAAATGVPALALEERPLLAWLVASVFHLLAMPAAGVVMVLLG